MGETDACSSPEKENAGQRLFHNSVVGAHHAERRGPDLGLILRGKEHKKVVYAYYSTEKQIVSSKMF